MADLTAATAMLDAHLRREEGERLYPYLCDAGVPTIGVGATTYLDGRKVTLADPPISVEQMARMLQVEIDRYCTAVLRMTDQAVTNHQLVGLVLLAYNIGLAGLEKSTVLRCHRAGDFAAAARAFALWNKYRPAGPGTPLVEHPALTARRQREAAIYATSDDPDAPARAPQAVEPESSMVSSPINKAGLAAAGTGVVSIVAQASESLGGLGGPLRSARDLLVDTLGVPTGWILPIVLVGVGVAVWYWRNKQRAGGWA